MAFFLSSRWSKNFLLISSKAFVEALASKNLRGIFFSVEELIFMDTMMADYIFI